MTRITCKDLVLGYEHFVVAENLSFTVESEDYLCIIGENGTGKSTLMKGILGLHPPLSGSIIRENQCQVGYLPQQTATQRDFPASVQEIVISGCQRRCKLRPFYNAQEKALAEENMERLHILEMRKKPYRKLSGGQQQRVLLARALCATQDILLLDEPTNGLDSKVSQEFYEIIDQLHQDGITILMISHDLDRAVAHSTKILKLGKETFFGTTKEFIEKYPESGGKS